MSGMERCVNKRCDDFGFLHEGMCTKTINQQENIMKHTITLNLDGVSRTQLEGFLAATPENAEYTTNIRHKSGERRRESATVTAELVASWPA